PVLVAGVGIFLSGSLLAGLSRGTLVLLVARAVQGLGAACLFTSTLAVIGDLFPPPQRARYMGLIGGVMGISSVIGPLAGGVITDTLGWNWVFFINLPIGGVALWFIITRMPRLGGRRGAARVDVAGAAWLLAGVVPLLFALSAGASPAVSLALGVAGVAGLVVFVQAERRAEDPILDLRLFRRREVVLPLAAMFVLGGAFLF